LLHQTILLFQVLYYLKVLYYFILFLNNLLLWKSNWLSHHFCASRNFNLYILFTYDKIECRCVYLLVLPRTTRGECLEYN